MQVASRSVTLHSIIELWGFGATAEELHQRVCSYPQEIIESCLDINSSFCVKVETFGKTFSMKEKVSKIESFNYLPAQGPVKLKDPDVSLFYIEYYGLEPLKAPKEAYNYFFGVWVRVLDVLSLFLFFIIIFKQSILIRYICHKIQTLV